MEFVINTHEDSEDAVLLLWGLEAKITGGFVAGLTPEVEAKARDLHQRLVKVQNAAAKERLSRLG